MMAPLIGAPIGHVRDRSLARRRRRAAVLFASAYALPWVAAGVVLLTVARWIVASGSPVAWALALITVALFQASPQKQRCLNRRHGHPALAAFGARADLDVLRFGLAHAAWCIGSCFALMLLPMLVTRSHLVVMAAVTLWLAGERLERPAQPRWRWRVPVEIARVALSQARACFRLLERNALPL
jgi:predicted metal-binding membrane protein